MLESPSGYSISQEHAGQEEERGNRRKHDTHVGVVCRAAQGISGLPRATLDVGGEGGRRGSMGREHEWAAVALREASDIVQSSMHMADIKLTQQSLDLN